ncbi:unnamed protein product, partial [Nesidiocoris tenuis]
MLIPEFTAITLCENVCQAIIGWNEFFINNASMGVYGPILSWIESYLSDRRQFVRFKNVVSEPYRASSGIPQGSNIGPLLFVIMINSVTSIPRPEGVELLMFADDLKIFGVVSSEDDYMGIQTFLDSLQGWCLANCLHLNPAKCTAASFSRSSRLLSFPYRIGGGVLDRPASIRDLGVFMDAKLTFSHHIDAIVSKALRALGFLKRCTRDFTSMEAIVLLYKSLVRPILEYSSVVWSPYYQVHKERLERVQRRFLRYLNFKMHIPLEELDIVELAVRSGLQDLEFPTGSSACLRNASLPMWRYPRFLPPCSLSLQQSVTRNYYLRRPKSSKNREGERTVDLFYSRHLLWHSLDESSQNGGCTFLAGIYISNKSIGDDEAEPRKVKCKTENPAAFLRKQTRIEPGEPTTPTPAQRAQPLQKKITGPDQMAPAPILGKLGCGGCLIPTTAPPESRAVISTSSGQLPQKPTGLSSKSPEIMNSGSPGNTFSNSPQQQPPTPNQYSVYSQPGVFSGSPGSNSYQKPPQPPPTFLLTPYIDDKNVPSSFTESPIPGLSSSDRPQKPSTGNPQTISQNPVPIPGGEISSGTLAKVPPLPLSDAAFPTLPPDVPIMKISLDISDPKTREFMLKMPELIENVKSREELQALLYTFNYTLTYHGHNEVGNVAGDKNGSYFFNGQDGLGRNVTYVANEFGYQPNITLYDISERETPNEKTEKDLTELLGNEFKCLCLSPREVPLWVASDTHIDSTDLFRSDTSQILALAVIFKGRSVGKSTNSGHDTPVVDTWNFEAEINIFQTKFLGRHPYAYGLRALPRKDRLMITHPPRASSRRHQTPTSGLLLPCNEQDETRIRLLGCWISTFTLLKFQHTGHKFPAIVSGQYRKEKRLQDGTVVGSYGWVDANGYLRLRDYIADDKGYRIVRTKLVKVGVDTPIDNAITIAKKTPANTGVNEVAPVSLSSYSNEKHVYESTTRAPIS